MRLSLRASKLLAALVLLASLGSGQASTLLMQKDLASQAGKEVQMVEVELPPGVATPKHRHNAQTFVYVLEGQVEMQIEGQSAQTLKVGQTFYESPTDVHTLSRNPSTSQTAKLLVVFVKTKGSPSLVPER